MLTTLPIVLGLLVGAPAPNAPTAPVLETRVADAVDDEIAKGRQALIAGDLDAARAAFEAAAGLEDSWRTKLWTLRMTAESDPETVLGALSREQREGRKGPEVDYLFGIAFTRQADAAAASGSGSPGLLYTDAVQRLKTALEADADRFGDAWVVLASAARNVGDNAESLRAAERALAAAPASTTAHDLRGRAALALFAARAQEQPRPDEVSALYDAAVESFTRVTQLIERPADPAQEALLAGSWYQLGNTHAYGDNLGSARNAYGEAMGWAPDAIDISAVFNVLGLERFVGCIDFATERFVERHQRDARESTVQWWLGWALFESSGDLERAETAFERAVALWPGYTNSWYYLMRIRYDLQGRTPADERDYGPAIDALRRYNEVDRQGMVATLSANSVDEDRIVYLVGQAAVSDVFAAADLSEILTALKPENDEYWNNLGLFLRDSAAVRAQELSQMRRRGEAVDPVEDELVMARYESAWEAYSRALDLVPENPRYHNDAAVMLHYYLEREYERALSMYDKSIELANSALDEGGLSSEDADQMRTYIGWATDNKRLLMNKMAAEAEAEDAGGEGTR